MTLPDLNEVFAVRFYERLRQPTETEIRLRDEMTRATAPQFMGMSKVVNGQLTMRSLTESEIEETVTRLREAWLNENEAQANIQLKDGSFLQIDDPVQVQMLKARMQESDACVILQADDQEGLKAETFSVNTNNMSSVTRSGSRNVLFMSLRAANKGPIHVSWECTIDELETQMHSQGFSFDKDDSGAASGFIYLTNIKTVVPPVKPPAFKHK